MDGNAPKNALVIELLSKHGVEGKTASSNISDEEEAMIAAELKAMGYKRGGETEEAPVKAPEKKPEAAEKDKAPAEEKPVAEKAVQAKPAQENAPAEKPAQEAAKAAPAAEGEKRPQQQGQQIPPKKKRSIIIVGGNNNPHAQQQRPGNGPRPSNAPVNRGPIRPRENMIDRAGAISNRREAEEAKIRDAEEAKLREQAAAAREQEKPAETNTVSREREVVSTQPARPQAPARPMQQGQQGNAGRPARPDFRQGGGRNDQRGFNGQSRPGGGRPAPAPAPAANQPQAGDKGGRKHNNKDKDRDKRDRRDSMFDEDGQVGHGRNSNAGRFIKPVAKKQEVPEDDIKVIVIPEKLTIKDLADKMRVAPAEIVKKLFMQGEMVTVNQEISFEKAEEIAIEYEIMCEKEEKVDVIAELLKEDDEDESKLVPRPPVICVMGHVDHGKTSLLDAIRKTNVTDKEAGGITQHIGAYMVKINDREITFLDTPGHEAFTSMRMRGANSTDIAILVVAADDGVMPQTVEAINHAKAAGIEIIVAVNKIDKPGANIDRVKQELTEYELVSEDWGGSTIFAPVSAKTGEGIEDLLEMILLTADVLELKANPRRRGRGLVIEAELDKGRGPVATVLVQKGTLRVGDFISAGAAHGKVRAMVDDKGRRVKEAGPSTPVEILGLDDVPNAGEIFICHPNEKEAKNFADTFIAQNKEKLLEDTKAKMSLDDLFSKIQEGNLKELNLIIKADVQGSVEAVKQSLTKLSNEEVVVKVIHGGVGAINESDVVLASASNAIIIGFNVRPDAMAKQTAEREGVDVRLYKVIYQAIEDIEAAMKGMLDPVYEEKVIGHAEVRQIFKASAIGNIAGSYVLDGEFKRDCKIRIKRGDEQVYEGSLASLKRFKDDVKEVKAGYECGLVFDGYDGMQELDIVEAYIMVEVPR